jgi:hypothetical protein
MSAMSADANGRGPDMPHDYRTEPEWFAWNIKPEGFLDRLERQCPAWMIGIGIVTVLTLYLTS